MSNPKMGALKLTSRRLGGYFERALTNYRQASSPRRRLEVDYEGTNKSLANEL